METIIDKLKSYRTLMDKVCENCTDHCDFSDALDCLEGELEREESCGTCAFGGTPSYKSPCSECHSNNSKYEKAVE